MYVHMYRPACLRDLFTHVDVHACIDVGCTGGAVQMDGCLVVGGGRGANCVVDFGLQLVEYTMPVLDMVVCMAYGLQFSTQGGLYEWS